MEFSILPAEEYAYVRFLNAVYNNEGIDIYIDGELAYSNLKYMEFTEYKRMGRGSITIEVFEPGTTTNPLYRSRNPLRKDIIYTGAFTGVGNTMTMQFVIDDKRSETVPGSHIRFIDLTPEGLRFDIYLDNEKVVTDLTFLVTSDYVTTTPGQHNLKIKIQGQDDAVITHPQLFLRPGTFYAGYIIGTYTEANNDLLVLIPLEGTTYI